MSEKTQVLVIHDPLTTEHAKRALGFLEPFMVDKNFIITNRVYDLICNTNTFQESMDSLLEELEDCQLNGHEIGLPRLIPYDDIYINLLDLSTEVDSQLRTMGFDQLPQLIPETKIINSVDIDSQTFKDTTIIRITYEES